MKNPSRSTPVAFLLSSDWGKGKSEMNAKIVFPETKSKITAVKVVMKCPECGHSWAFYLDMDNCVPSGADVCVPCRKEKDEQFKSVMSEIER